MPLTIIKTIELVVPVIGRSYSPAFWVGSLPCFTPLHGRVLGIAAYNRQFMPNFSAPCHQTATHLPHGERQTRW